MKKNVFILSAILGAVVIMMSGCATMSDKVDLAGMEKDMGPAGTMIFVPGGCYEMGDLYGSGNKDEQHVHKVCVDDFYIGKYEVSQKEWVKVMGSNPSTYSECENCPVERVSWDDALEYGKKISENSDFNFRLPTEAEFEYACRDRGKKVKYGNGKDTLNTDEANFDGESYRARSIEVGKLAANTLGLYDMSGNIWEWTYDYYNKDAYKEHKRKNPVYVDTGDYRVVRGGGFRHDINNQRCSNRASISHTFRWRYLGFRLVAEEKKAE